MRCPKCNREYSIKSQHDRWCNKVRGRAEKVYNVLEGPMTTAQVAKELGWNHATAYYALMRLKEMNLVIKDGMVRGKPGRPKIRWKRRL